MFPVSSSLVATLENNDLIASSVTRLVNAAAKLHSLQQSEKITQVVNWNNLVALYRTGDDFWGASALFAMNFHVVLLSHESNPSARKTQDYVRAVMQILSGAMTERKLPAASRSLCIKEVMNEMCTQEIQHFVKQQPLHLISLESLIAEIIRLKIVFPEIKAHVFFESLCKGFVHRRLAYKGEQFPYTGEQYVWTQQEDLSPKSIQKAALEELARLARIEEALKEIDAQSDPHLIQAIIRNEVERRIEFLDSFQLRSSNSLITHSKIALESQLEHLGLTVEAIEDLARISMLQSESTQQIRDMLDQWVKGGIKGEQREIARWRILSFLAREQQDTLDLKGLNLTTCPPIFGPLFRWLKHLDLSNYDGNLSCSNYLVMIPDWIGQLENLETLKLSGALGILSLPESMKQLHKLKTFMCTGISVCPENFSDILSELKGLESLSLTCCELTSIPQSIFKLTNLNVLDLSGNLLRSFPQELCNLVRLENLDLKNNLIDSLPETICCLQQLIFLNLEDNELENVPLEIIKLSPRCQVNLLDNGISSVIRNQICDIMDQTSRTLLPEIQGVIRQKVSNRKGSSDQIIPLKALIKELFAAAWLPLQNFPILQDPKNEGTVRDWLSRLFGTADYEPSARVPYLIKVEHRRSFARSVIQTMEQAEDNLGFRKVFLRIIQNMTASCEDSITLSCLYVRLEYRFDTLLSNDVQGLADLLIKGVWALQMLENFAQYKISTLEYLQIEHDPIEVYLDYFVTLKDPLQLPIDVSQMKYASHVELEDTEAAKEFILKKQEDPNEVARFLINDGRWVAMLKRLYTDRYEATEKEVAKISTDGCVTDEDYRKAEEEIVAKRIALTLDILKETKATADSSKGKEPA